MAEKRMFSQKIVESDDFLDMPCSAQSLYFHLNMNADDDGFVNNARSVARAVRSSAEDLNLLIEERFVLSFDNCIVIKHWRMHNTLRKDRYKPTQYQDEFAMLAIKENGGYTEYENIGNQVATKRQPLGNQMATQISIDKNSLEEISIEECNEDDSDESVAEKKPKTDYKSIVDLYNSICTSFPSVRSLSEARKKAIKARLNTYTVDDFKQLFENAEASSFLKGDNNRKWSATFDWLIADSNMAKVLDGNYANKDMKATSFDANDFFSAALDRSRREMGVSPRSAIERAAAERMDGSESAKTAADDPVIMEKAEALKNKIASF